MIFEKAFLVKAVNCGEVAIVTATSKSKAIMQGVEAFQCEKNDVEILDYNAIGKAGKDCMRTLKLYANMQVLGELSREIGEVFSEQISILDRMVKGIDPTWALKSEVNSLEEKVQQLRDIPILSKKIRNNRNDIIMGFSVVNDRLLVSDCEEAAYYLALTRRLLGEFFDEITPELEGYSAKVSELLSKLTEAQTELLGQMGVRA